MLKKPFLYFRDLLSNVKKKGLTPQIWDGGGGVTKNFYNYFFLSSNLFLTVKEKKRANKA